MADAEKARAQLREAEANRADLQIMAPFDGTITVRSVEPGEVINPGTAIVTLVNLQELYLRVFVPIAEIDRVRVGQQARIYLDSRPDALSRQRVSRIDPDAAFTPENTYYREDRPSGCRSEARDQELRRFSEARSPVKARFSSRDQNGLHATPVALR